MTDNQKLLEACYENIEMGLSSLNTLKKSLKGKDNKIVPFIEDEIKEYELKKKKLKKLISKYKVDVEKIGVVPKISSKMGIKMNVSKDNSDSKVSDILIKGYTMGIVELSKRIDDFKEEGEKEVLEFAKDLHKFLEESVSTLKEFL